MLQIEQIQIHGKVKCDILSNFQTMCCSYIFKILGILLDFQNVLGTYQDLGILRSFDIFHFLSIIKTMSLLHKYLVIRLQQNQK